MGNIRIVADSTCDLSAELKEQYHIITIPLCIVMEDQSHYDGEDITPDQICGRMLTGLLPRLLRFLTKRRRLF